ncbi:MAG: hypothetical protein L6Q49_21460 [Anaerolineales bacterium]|nr:hypothetical protein [Anaerolineales bacterium]
MKRIHILLGVQSFLAVFVSFNRLTDWFTDYVLPNQFLRWVDLNNILVSLISLVAGYLLKKTIEYNSPAREGRAHTLWNLVFFVGVYLSALSYGFHEMTNYLHIRFCEPDPGSDLCRIIIFNDDVFSHWLFFAGFTMVNGAILFLQDVFPHPKPVSGSDIGFLLVNSLFLGAGVFANLGFEEIGFDLFVVGFLALVSAYLLWKRGRQPMFVYYTAAYWLGLAGGLLAQAIR